MSRFGYVDGLFRQVPKRSCQPGVGRRANRSGPEGIVACTTFRLAGGAALRANAILAAPSGLLRQDASGSLVLDRFERL
jgi:hypothetical protein